LGIQIQSRWLRSSRKPRRKLRFKTKPEPELRDDLGGRVL